jgi:hypothetical protein
MMFDIEGIDDLRQALSRRQDLSLAELSRAYDLGGT